jgi:hypothetical protein
MEFRKGEGLAEAVITSSEQVAQPTLLARLCLGVLLKNFGTRFALRCILQTSAGIHLSSAKSAKLRPREHLEARISDVHSVGVSSGKPLGRTSHVTRLRLAGCLVIGWHGGVYWLFAPRVRSSFDKECLPALWMRCHLSSASSKRRKTRATYGSLHPSKVRYLRCQPVTKKVEQAIAPNPCPLCS